MEGKKIKLIVWIVGIVFFIGLTASSAFTGENWRGLTGAGGLFLFISIMFLIEEMKKKKKRIAFLMIFFVVGLILFAVGLLMRFARGEFLDTLLLYKQFLSFMVVGGVGLTAILAIPYSIIRKKKYCTYKVSAQVVDILSDHSDDTTVYCPIYEFYYNGEPHRIKNNLYSNTGVPDIGEFREIYVDIENMDEYYEPKSVIKSSILYAVVGGVFLFFGVSGMRSYYPQKLPVAINLVDTDSINAIFDDGEGIGADGLDNMFDWMWHYSWAVEKDVSQFTREWVDPSTLAYPEEDITEAWRERNAEPEPTSNMFTMFLVQGYIYNGKTDDDYSGEYLKYDIDAIDNSDYYENLRNNEKIYCTIFGENKVVDGEKPEDAFPRMWNTHGFSMLGDECTLITIVVYNPAEKTTYVRESGALFHTKKGYRLFLEKRGMGLPYQATRVRKDEDIAKILYDRPENKGTDGNIVYIYANDRYMSHPD